PPHTPPPFPYTTLFRSEYAQVAPEPIRRGEYRYVRTLPVVFSPLEPHTLYFAANVLFKTTDAGNSWQVISPDLTREAYEVPANLDRKSTRLNSSHDQIS